MFSVYLVKIIIMTSLIKLASIQIIKIQISDIQFVVMFGIPNWYHKNYFTPSFIIICVLTPSVFHIPHVVSTNNPILSWLQCSRYKYASHFFSWHGILYMGFSLRLVLPCVSKLIRSGWQEVIREESIQLKHFGKELEMTQLTMCSMIHKHFRYDHG